MSKLLWDAQGERFFETGVDRGVLYIPLSGAYTTGFAWNGLTAITESPSGAEASSQYADNIEYLTLLSAEKFGLTVEAFTYPDEFGQCDGTASPAEGVTIGQQDRKPFGLSYRTKLGNDIDGADHGYKIHLVYGCLAAPTEKAFATVNDSPEAATFSWELTTTAAQITGHKPVASIVLDSTKLSSAALLAVEEALYGTEEDMPALPSPDELLTLISTAA